jgi:ABC-type Mn2+/Zn2+ transport system ATPase subunit
MYQFAIKDPKFLPHVGCELELKLHPGGALILVGQNGIGKSSILRHLANSLTVPLVLIEQPSPDYFFDRSLSKMKHIVLSSKSVNPEVFHELWGLFGLSEKEDRSLFSLSGGEGQALKICLGLSLERDLYFLDEPSQFLDDRSRRVLDGALKKLGERGASILMVEHDLKWPSIRADVQELKIEHMTIKKGEAWTI